MTRVQAATADDEIRRQFSWYNPTSRTRARGRERDSDLSCAGKEREREPRSAGGGGIFLTGDLTYCQAYLGRGSAHTCIPNATGLRALSHSSSPPEEEERERERGAMHATAAAAIALMNCSGAAATEAEIPKHEGGGGGGGGGGERGIVLRKYFSKRIYVGRESTRTAATGEMIKCRWIDES